MPTLPIPLISSIILGFLLLNMWLTDRRHGPLVILLSACAVQGVIIALAQHYRVPGFGVVQAITATFIPAIAWVAFQATAVRHFQIRDLIHVIGPVCAMLSLMIMPHFLDLLIPALFCGYGIAILAFGSTGADALPRMRLDAGDLPRRIWQVIGAALLLSALSDVLIVAAQIFGVGHWQPWIISIYSSVMLIVVGGLSLSGALENVAADEEATPEQRISDEDVQIVAKLNAVMTDQKMFLNPDLTLAQLSRKILVPVKQLSGAINRVTGENVSRYINAARIAAAQDALRAGENVTNAMLSSGFNTKSNFNREFLRVVGKSPSEWLDAEKQRTVV